MWRWILLAVAIPCSAAVVHDADSNASEVSAPSSSTSWTHTTGSITNPFIVCGAMYRSVTNPNNVSAFTNNGVSLTFVNRLVGGGSPPFMVETWIGVGSTQVPTGSHTVSVTLTSALSGGFDYLDAGCSTFSGAAQSGQPDGSNTTGGTLNNPSLSITMSNSGDVMFGVVSGGYTTADTVAFNTNNPFCGTSCFADYKNAPGSGSQSMSWTGFAAGAISLIGIAPASSGPTTDQIMSAMNQNTNTPVFQPCALLTYFRRRRYYVRAWLARLRRGGPLPLTELLNADGTPAFEAAFAPSADEVESYRLQHGRQ